MDVNKEWTPLAQKNHVTVREIYRMIHSSITSIQLDKDWKEIFLATQRTPQAEHWTMVC